MRSIPPRHRAALARRIAAGLPLWAAARGSAIPADDVSGLMGEPEFRELIEAWADIFELDDEARKRRLLTLASMILEDRLAKGCDRTAWFVSRQYHRKHGPREALAKGFAQLLEMEKARGERFGKPAEPVPAPAPPPTPVHAAMAAAEVARKLRGKPDPVDAAAWRLAGTLRRQMLGEQVLFAAAAPKPVEAILAAAGNPAQAAPAAQPQAQPKLNRAQRRRQEKLKKARPAKPAPPPVATAPEAGDSDAAFRERAIKTFAATFAAAPPHLRAALDRLTPQQRLALIDQCWPKDEAFDESPQGP
jgi:hypothetical protein